MEKVGEGEKEGRRRKGKVEWKEKRNMQRLNDKRKRWKGKRDGKMMAWKRRRKRGKS